MKKILPIIIFSFLMIFPLAVKAGNVSVSLSCPGAANVGETISCQVNVSSDVLVNGLSGNYSLSGLSYVNFVPQNGFVSYGVSPSGFAIGNTSGKSGTFTVGVVSFLVNGAGTVSINNLDASDVDKSAYSPAAVSSSVRIKSTNNDIGSLSISPGTLSPSFSAGTLNYTATVDAASITISGTKGDTYQSISGLGVKNLGYGANTFNVVVASEAGTTKTYTLTITRPDNRSTNANLKSLSVSQGSIPFNKGATSYSLNVDSNVTSITVNAALEDSRATFVGGLGPRTVNLNYGNNVILIKTMAENGTVYTYTLNVNRKDNRSTNNYLKSLSLSSGKLTFDKNTLEYNVSVYYDVTKLEIIAAPEDSKATITVNNPDLVVGDNIVTINVTSENQVVRTYKINVKRLSEEEKMSDNNKVSTLSIFGHELEFKDKQTDYNVTIGKDEKELIFNILLEDERASYVVEGNENLKDGSVVYLTVVSESGNRQGYKFIIEQEKSLAFVWYILTGLGGITVGFVLGFFFSKFKKTTKSVQNDTTINVVNNENRQQ